MLVLNKEQNFSKLPKFLVPEPLFPLKRGTEGVLERRRLLACSLALGTREAHLEQPQASGTPEGQLERRRLSLLLGA